MKTILKTLLILSSCLFLYSFTSRAFNNTIRAGVVVENIDGPLKVSDKVRLGSRQELQQGQVFEVISRPPSLQLELKIDSERVVVVSPRYIKIRECTSEEFTAAQERFNASNFDAERRKIEESYRKALAKAREGMCATCPKVRAAVAERENEIRKMRRKQLDELNGKKRNLLNEALEWAAEK